MARMSEAMGLAERLFTIAGSSDIAARQRLIHPDCEIVMSGAGRLTREELADYSRVLATAFPRAGHAIDRILEIGDSVVVQGSWIATHTGPFVTPHGHIPATGRTINTRLCLVCRVCDGQAVSIHGYWDQLEMLEQLGLVPEPEAV
jgi:ketosteroid isomerase-like protein